MEMLFRVFHVWLPNIKKAVIEVLDFSFSFLKKYEERKPHNMLPFMLDLRLKTLHLVSSLIGGEQGKTIVEEYDKKSLFQVWSLNVIMICIHCLNLKGVLLIKTLKSRRVWIFLRWQLAQMIQQLYWSIMSFWFSCIIKWMLKTSNVHYNGGKTWKHVSYN